MIVTPSGRAYADREELLADVARQAGAVVRRAARAQIVLPLLGERSLGTHLLHPSPDVAARCGGLVAACRADGAIHVAIERLLWDGREARAVVAWLVPERRAIVEHPLGVAIAASIVPSPMVLSIIEALAAPLPERHQGT